MELVTRILDGVTGLMFAGLPAALLYWLLIHSLASRWRRLGPLPTYLTVSTICLAVAYVIWRQRESLMAGHLGYRPIPIALGCAVCLAAGVWDRGVLRRLGFAALAGLPEVSARRQGELLTDGPYSLVRHPRYLGALLTILGLSLILNYPWLYALVAASVPVGWILIALEERELRQRFGGAYLEYASRVPRFVPRRRSER